MYWAIGIGGVCAGIFAIFLVFICIYRDYFRDYFEDSGELSPLIKVPPVESCIKDDEPLKGKCNEPKVIAVLGATGGTGREFVKQALARGHMVKALVRNPQKLDDIIDKNLEVINMDIWYVPELTKQLTGVDAVVSALGFSGGFGSPHLPWQYPMTIFSDIIKVLLPAMNANGIKRLVLVHSVYCKTQTRHEGYSFYKWFLPLMYFIGLKNMAVAEDILREHPDAKNIEWTALCPGWLMDGPVSDRKIFAEEETDRFPLEDFSEVKRIIDRADVARYMIMCVEKGLHKKMPVAIALKYE